MARLNEKRMINDIRCLALDMINEAGSGHPGIALGAAPIIYTLFTNHLNFDLTKSRQKKVVSSMREYGYLEQNQATELNRQIDATSYEDLKK